MTAIYTTISALEYELVSHVLTLGYAAMAAALFFFILTYKTNSPKYRMTVVLSVVVMVSAFLLLYKQQDNWEGAFALGADGSYTYLNNFSNGFRYLNWLIDVPMLLIQILFVVGIAGVAFKKYFYRFAGFGVLMILTGYIGQFYEPNYGLDDSGNLAAWLIWGAISTVFYIFVLYYITQVLNEGRKNIAGSKAQGLFAVIRPLFYIAWTIYPVAYVMPLFADLELLNFGSSIVSQQVLYTVADISSKVVYGVILQIVSTILSREQGYQEA
ncbi:MAG: bacteriorhodopsin [Acholeplasmataceae bacterium]